MKTLTQAQQETFEKFKDCASELNDANEMTSFTLGFKLGMRLALEAMISTSDITEPNISGKISDERFAKLSETYEAEQKQLVLRIAELEAFFAKDQEQTVNLKTFMQHVKRYINLDHLDAEVLRTFIKRIVIMDTMPGKKGKGIEVKIEYTIDGEYKTYPEQQDRKTA